MAALLEAAGAEALVEVVVLASRTTGFEALEALETLYTAAVGAAWVDPTVAAEASVGMATPAIAALQRVIARACLRAGAGMMDRRLNVKISDSSSSSRLPG